MILSRIRILPQERFDLEDLNAMLAAARTDAKYNVKKLISNLNYVVNGFTVTGIGLKSAIVNMSNGTLLIPENSNDFSWFTTAPSDPNVTIPDADLVDGVRNYVEMSLVTENNTPVTRAFWDPEANGGLGLEFNQIVSTITDLKIEFIVSTGGFSGSPDRLPLCIIDTDGTGTIKSILDERKLFHRLGTPSDPANEFAWSTKAEPPYTMTMSGVTGVFQADEQISIGTEVATVVVGGSSSITFRLPSSKNFFPGDAVLGLTSGATGTVATVSESFTGVDKSIMNLKQDLDAIKTELLLIKNPSGFWWSTTESIVDLRASISAIEDILDSPSYDEDYTIGAPISSGATITIPVNSRLAGSPQQFYTVGKGALEVWLNGQRLSQNVGGGWSEVGVLDAASSSVTINQDLDVDDLLEFRLGLGGASAGGGGGGGSAPDDDFNTLPESLTADNLDLILIRDVSLGAYRKQKRSTFLAGLGSTLNVQTYAANHTADVNLDDVILVDATTGNKTITLPDPTTCNGKVFYLKKIDASANSMIINGAGFDVDGQPSISSNVQYESTPIVADSANSAWWSI